MAMYPGRAGEILMSNPGTVGAKGSNLPVKRVVMHTSAGSMSEKNQAPINVATWNSTAGQGALKVSAHFTIEFDGRVIQHVDTARIAYGTGWVTAGSIHIEEAGNHPHPMNPAQLAATATLIAWLNKEHPDIALAPTGVSASDPGDPEKPGITCHKFVQVA